MVVEIPEQYTLADDISKLNPDIFYEKFRLL